MRKLPSNKKKIRGKKDKYKAIEKWKTLHKNIDLKLLKEYGAEYAHLNIMPWAQHYSTDRMHCSYRTPPPEFQIEILRAMIEVYDSLKSQISREEDFIDYDLKIWLYYPSFINSCIALSYRTITLENEGELVVCDKEFRIDRFPSLSQDLEQFSFKSFFRDQIFYESEFGIAQYHTQRRFFSRDEMMKKMIKLGALRQLVIFENGQRDVKYTVRDENMILWIGTKEF